MKDFNFLFREAYSQVGPRLERKEHSASELPHRALLEWARLQGHPNF